MIAGLPGVTGQTEIDAEITDISYDSRFVKPGSLFVALPGVHTDGHKFARAAIDGGAVAVVAQMKPEGLPKEVPVVLVRDSRQALGDIANRFFDYPSRKMKLIGVTGTDGKTTTSFLTMKMLELAGHPAGIISTVFFQTGSELLPNSYRQTTPESVEVQGMLAEMVDHGKEYAVVESTSHGLALDRLVGCEYDVAVMTNVTHEHLEYHKTFDGYRDAKARLFQMLDSSIDKGAPKTAVINADDPNAEYFRNCTKSRVLDYGINNQAAVIASDIDASARGNSFHLATPAGECRVNLPLPGDFNVYNALAAACAVMSQGVGLDIIQKGLDTAVPVPGRMQRVDEGQRFSVIVDYAHTPESLEKVLKILRPLTAGRLMVVFGSAGERDLAKRPWMGRIAAELSDFFVVANEDPRFEDEMKILREIGAGARESGKIEGKDYLLIPDRREAIWAVVAAAQAGDTILLAGKGHEQCIIVGDQKVPWDEATVARELLRIRR